MHLREGLSGVFPPVPSPPPGSCSVTMDEIQQSRWQKSLSTQTHFLSSVLKGSHLRTLTTNVSGDELTDMVFSWPHRPCTINSAADGALEWLRWRCSPPCAVSPPCHHTSTCLCRACNTLRRGKEATQVATGFPAVLPTSEVKFCLHQSEPFTKHDTGLQNYSLFNENTPKSQEKFKHIQNSQYP